MGLVSFSDTATVNSMLSPVVEQAARAAEGLTAGGKSNPAEAIRAAVKLLDMKTPGEKMLFLITDGQTPFRSQTDSAAAEARQAGVTVYCIGIAAPDGVNREARGLQGRPIPTSSRFGSWVKPRQHLSAL